MSMDASNGRLQAGRRRVNDAHRSARCVRLPSRLAWTQLDLADPRPVTHTRVGAGLDKVGATDEPAWHCYHTSRHTISDVV